MAGGVQQAEVSGGLNHTEAPAHFLGCGSRKSYLLRERIGREWVDLKMELGLGP